MAQLMDCIDAGSDYCPCYLAETGDCIVCSQLQGKGFCDCTSWKGVCIYQEYVWNKSKMKEPRESYRCKIINKQTLNSNVMLFKIQVKKTLARELNQPGAYVFLRDYDDPYYFDAPMSVLKADEKEGSIEIAVQKKGIKTSTLFNKEDSVYLRGPYWNGLLGLKYIKGLNNSRALFVARGIGQAPVLQIANKLLLAGNRVEAFLDEGQIGVNLAEPYLKELGCDIIKCAVFDPSAQVIPKEALKHIKQAITERGIRLIYSGGSEKLHLALLQMLAAFETKVYFTCSNNARLCCGEGICGSCQVRLSDGNRIKTCKTQLNPIKFIKGGNSAEWLR